MKMRNVWLLSWLVIVSYADYEYAEKNCHDDHATLGNDYGDGNTDLMDLLSCQENRERLDNCGIKPDPSKGYDRNSSWWLGRFSVGKIDGPGNFRFHAALISKRHAIISHGILQGGYKNHVRTEGEQGGFNCPKSDPKLVNVTDTFLIFPNASGISNTVKWKKALYYNRCGDGIDKDGIVIVELEKDIDMPYLCLPDYHHYKSIGEDLRGAVGVKYRRTISKINNDSNPKGFWYEPEMGRLQTHSNLVNDKYNWLPLKARRVWIEVTDGNGETRVTSEASVPIVTDEERPKLIAIGHKAYITSIVSRDLDDFLPGLCVHVGICPDEPPITTTIPTTTTTPPPTTPPTLPTTTHYVPTFLLDKEMQDFEIPYHRKQRVKSGGVVSEITVVLIMVLVWVL